MKLREISIGGIAAMFPIIFSEITPQEMERLRKELLVDQARPLGMDAVPMTENRMVVTYGSYKELGNVLSYVGNKLVTVFGMSAEDVTRAVTVNDYANAKKHVEGDALRSALLEVLQTSQQMRDMIQALDAPERTDIKKLEINPFAAGTLHLFLSRYDREGVVSILHSWYEKFPENEEGVPFHIYTAGQDMIGFRSQGASEGALLAAVIHVLSQTRHEHGEAWIDSAGAFDLVTSTQFPEEAAATLKEAKALLESAYGHAAGTFTLPPSVPAARSGGGRSGRS